MLRHNFLITVRNLMRNKSFSFINIFGLAFGLACCLMIYRFIRFEYSYNTFLPNHEDIYQVLNDSAKNFDKKFQVDHRFAQYLPETYGQIQSACSFLTGGTNVRYNENNYSGKLIFTDSSFFDVFPFPFVYGSPKASFGPEKIIISEEMATKIFGALNPIGEIVTLGLNEEYVVSGIIDDVPLNSSLQFDLIIPHNNNLSKSESCSNDECIEPKLVFVRFQPGIEGFEINSEDKALRIFSNEFPMSFAFQSLDNLYLHDRYNVTGLEKGNLRLIRIFLGIALIILTLAILNYVNLSLSRIISRYKEIGLKKTIGASRFKLFYQLLFESILITSISFILAILISELGTPFLISLYGKAIPTSSYLSFPDVFILFGTPIAVGVIAGIYPSIVFSRYSPKRILSGCKGNSSGKNPFMYYLTVVQFCIAIILISYTMVMFMQIDYVKHKDLGFNEEHLLKIGLYGEAREKHEFLSNSLRAHPKILGVSTSEGTPGQITMRVRNNDTEGNTVAVINIDTNYLEVFNINLLAGRKLLSGDINKVAYVNKTSMEVLQWDSIQGKKFEEKEIIGIVNDFHTGSLYNSIEPVFLVYDNTKKPQNLTIRLDGNQISETMNFIRAQWKKVSPDFPVRYEFYDDYFDSMYKKEERLSKLMSTFSILAIIISCLGIIGMVEFTTVNKTKEIGIRKTLGAAVIDIIKILTRTYFVIFAIAIALAIPVAWKISALWLQSFAYRMELSWLLFLASGSIIVLIALVTISFRTIKTALKNPVEALRYE